MEEIWKDIPQFEGIYQASNFGRIKSLTRRNYTKYGVLRQLEEKILKQTTEQGRYNYINLYRKGKPRTFRVHQLVAMTFLNHNPDGLKYVVNHIDLDKTNNHVSNLEIISNRDNCNRKHYKTSSIYTGVCWVKSKQKWMSSIQINGKSKTIGYFKNEYDAHLAYQSALPT